MSTLQLQNSKWLVLPILIPILLVACSDSPAGLRSSEESSLDIRNDVAAKGPIVFSATGSGQQLTGETPIPHHRTFSFNANRRQDGTVTGQVQVLNRTLDVRVKGTVTHVGFVPQTDIVFVCALETTIPPVSEGAFFFGVRDNGVGGSPPPDEITGTSDGSPGLIAYYCENPEILENTLTQFLAPIDGGEIQVRASL